MAKLAVRMRLIFLLISLISTTAFADGISRDDFIYKTGLKEGSYKLHRGIDHASGADDCMHGGPLQILQDEDGTVTLSLGAATPLMESIGGNSSDAGGDCKINKTSSTVAAGWAEVTHDKDCNLRVGPAKRRDYYKVSVTPKGFHFEHITLLNNSKKPSHYWRCDYER